VLCDAIWGVTLGVTASEAAGRLAATTMQGPGGLSTNRSPALNISSRSIGASAVIVLRSGLSRQTALAGVGWQ